MTEFDRWFKAQFGATPVGDARYQTLLKRVRDIERELLAANGDLYEARKIRQQHEAALLAWQVLPGSEFRR